ncbi:hypothetical protein EG19_01475 [Thermoanaerobaculum aquaticum]|uniref:2-amino-4-hydroxy-6-hydroxymethyldihydropteridine pyrophosphokinase n=1 Tax=Thermoanaerobaculum aquaticum TaxID=1312852 RepID=A0A062XN80_9BACT|nr:2-amino-4-hydroxy-6-hydroxymethyldihydropteridine diphosphokinase [Thermoanaerobaculum aquaticum]KDA54017.1 hypothetical protein EG19_01475 [Thermoanaerobaculum aquaticum]
MELLLGLGGNLGDVSATFRWVAQQIQWEARILAASSLYRTAPVGPPQPPFLNAALLLELNEDPLRFLKRCQAWERQAGRVREAETRWGPRPLDLDLLMAPGVVMVGPELTLPHPRLAERRFALLPVAEIAPHWLHPRLRQSLGELALALLAEGQACERIGAFPLDFP